MAKTEIFAFVYLITNLVNRKQYVGFTTKTPAIRLKRHAKDLKSSGAALLHAAIRKYGLHNFKVETLFHGPSGEALQKESEFIEEYGTLICGYNRCRGGVVPMLGYRHTAEFKEALSKRTKGKKYALGNKLSAETRRRMGESRRGNTHTKGHKLTEEHRAKIGAASSRFMNTVAALERCSEQTRRRWAAGDLHGRPVSDQHKEKLRQAALRQWASGRGHKGRKNVDRS